MKKILAMFLTALTVLSLAVSAFAATYDFNDLQDGDILLPGDKVTGAGVCYLNVTDAYDTDAPQYPSLGGKASADEDLYWANFRSFGNTLPNADAYYTIATSNNTEYPEFDCWVFYQDGIVFNSPAFFAGRLENFGVAEEEPVNENGEDFWKWWRNAARLTREQKTVTLNVPENFDNTVLPTFFFTAIKEANANVTLNINGKTYTLNANNLPKYYSWVSEVSVDVLG